MGCDSLLSPFNPPKVCPKGRPLPSSDSQAEAKDRTPSKCLGPPTLEVSKNAKEIPSRERQALSTQPRLVSAGLLMRRWGNLELEPTLSLLSSVICYPRSLLVADLRHCTSKLPQWWPPVFLLAHQLSFSFQTFLLHQGNTPSLKGLQRS